MAYMYHALTMLLLLSNRPQFTGMGDNNMATEYEADRQCLAVLKRPVAQQQAYEILHQAQKFCVADSSQVVDSRLRSAWGWPTRL
ncbi:hypothetical protein LTR17_011615 [Elasticomyces elasticus]|nr:hypothetical protein LTR17_011615 [Elasticomyces elasticus]